MFISPVEFSKLTGESYCLILQMCKEGKIKCEETSGGHFKIYRTEIEKFNKTADFISRDQYESVIRENERLKAFINQLKITINKSLLDI